MKNTGIVILILILVWVSICIISEAPWEKPEEIICIVANADTEPSTEPTLTVQPTDEEFEDFEEFWTQLMCDHEWSDWSVCKVDNIMGPGVKVRTCSVCGKERSTSFMETVNAISIPKLHINAPFLNTTEAVLVDADFIYSEPIDDKHPTVLCNVSLETLKQNDVIYINTDKGLAQYRVSFSEPATVEDGQLIGDRTHRGLWQHDYEHSLHLYNLDEETGWIVVAYFVGNYR